MEKTALIIEDSKQDADMLQKYLKEQGLKVHVSLCGEDGLKKAQKLKPHLIVLDLILPDIDGFDVCEQIKGDENLKGTKIIIISVKADVERIGKVLDVRADDYVVKTLMGEVPEDLGEKVKHHLGL